MNTRATLLAALLLPAISHLQAADPAKFEVGGLSFQRPTEWEWVPVNSSMRKAQLKVPGKAADQSAEITFFHFGAGSGGDVASNAKRWLAQFKSAKERERRGAGDLRHQG
jgi:hypothetical protein